MQKWMDSVPGQTFLNYAYSWGAAVVILGTLFKLTHLPGANVMLFLGMGTEVFVFFISAFDRPFDKSTIDMTLDNHMADEVIDSTIGAPLAESAHTVAAPAAVSQPVVIGGGQPAASQQITFNEEEDVAEQAEQQNAAVSQQPTIAGGTIIIGNGSMANAAVSAPTGTVSPVNPANPEYPANQDAPVNVVNPSAVVTPAPTTITPAPAVSQETAAAMEEATTAYVERLEQLNETLLKVEQLSARLATDSEEMENLNRTLTGIARVYEMQLKSASQQITTQDSINEQTNIMAEKIRELNAIYTRMIEAMTVNMNPLAGKA